MHLSSSFAFLSFLYSSNVSDISWTRSVKSGSCLLPLIWLAVASFDGTDISFVFHSRPLKQLNKIATQAEELKLLVNISSGMSLVWFIWLQSRLPTLIFFGSSSVSHLLLKSHFFVPLGQNLRYVSHFVKCKQKIKTIMIWFL